MSEAPRRTRRADRYHRPEEAAPKPAEPVLLGKPVLPSPDAVPHRASRTETGASQPVRQPQRTGTPPVQRQPSPVRTPADAPPPRMDRPPTAPQQKRKAPKRKKPAVPVWLSVLLAAALLAVAGQAVAQYTMNGWLKVQAWERERAHQTMLDEHPVLYGDLIAAYAAHNNLQPDFVKAIIMNESSYRWDAESRVGARGLMQLMPDTAAWIADKLGETGYNFELLLDPETNIRFGTWYLNYLSAMFRGDPVLVAAAYHAGQGEVTGWLSDRNQSADGVSIPLENMKEGPTKVYVGRVVEDFAIYHALAGEEADSLDGLSDAAAEPGAL